MASPITAANAYANLAKLANPGAPAGNSSPGLGTGKSPDSDGPSFGALVKDALGSVVDGGRKSDAQTVAMASGKANVMDVVTAVAETDVAVSTLVSVRDRVIQSYEDIMKMAI